MKLQPLATAFFAASPFTESKPNGLLSWRGDIWRDTDNQRSGQLPFVYSDDFGFMDYVEWALDVPMYFVLARWQVPRSNACDIPPVHEWRAQGRAGAAATDNRRLDQPSGHPCFLMRGSKRFIEMRGADGGPWRRICALPALWVGLLYDEQALGEAIELTSDWSFDEVNARCVI
jgi:glutamate--cysteine ligase